MISQTAFLKALKAHPALHEVSRQDLTDLGKAIDMEGISEAESASLLAALLPAQPAEKWFSREMRRIGTYTFILELAKQHQRLPNEDDLFEETVVPETVLPKPLLPVLDGYLCYRIRDALAVSHEAMLGLVCRELGGHEGSIHHGRVIRNIAGSTGGGYRTQGSGVDGG